MASTQTTTHARRPELDQLPRLDWSRGFLPDALAGAPAELWQLERRKLTQIAARGYVELAGAFEGAILRRSAQDPILHSTARAMARVLEQMRAFASAFDAGFDERVARAPLDAVIDAVADASPVALRLLAIHAAKVAERHVHAAEGGREPIDASFGAILRAHRDASAGPSRQRLGALLHANELEDAGARGVAYAKCRGVLAAAARYMRAQCMYDVDALERAMGRSLPAAEKAAVARAAYTTRRAAVLAPRASQAA